MLIRIYRSLVFDLDNTAVPESGLGVKSKELVEIFHSLDASVPAIAATSRTVENALPVLRDMALAYESIVSNDAQIIFSSTGRVLRENNLRDKQAGQIIELCHKHNLTTHCCITRDSMDSVLTASKEDLVSRVNNDSRKRFKKLTDPKIMNNITNDMTVYSIPYVSALNIDTPASTPDEAAQKIINLLELKTLNH